MSRSEFESSHEEINRSDEVIDQILRDLDGLEQFQNLQRTLIQQIRADLKKLENLSAGNHHVDE